jgi:hypothetical protein
MAIGRAKRGRPPTFESETRKMLAGLIRQHGARRAQEFAPVPVSVGTLLKIAREHGITLKKGRRPKRAA